MQIEVTWTCASIAPLSSQKQTITKVMLSVSIPVCAECKNVLLWWSPSTSQESTFRTMILHILRKKGTHTPEAKVITSE